MELKILSPFQPGVKEVSQLEKLYTICNEEDGTSYTFDFDEDFKEDGDKNLFLLMGDGQLIGSLSIFAPTKEEGEILTLIHPLWRRRGFFSSLLERGKEELKRRKILSILYVCDSRSLSGLASLDSPNRQYKFSEFLMEYQNAPIRQSGLPVLQKAQMGDREELSRILGRTFGQSLEESTVRIDEFLASEKRDLFAIVSDHSIRGAIGIYREKERSYIFGFGIDPDFQGQGLGRLALNEIVSLYKDEKKIIVLEVEAKNEKALGLYRKCGFSVISEFKYFHEKLE